MEFLSKIRTIPSRPVLFRRQVYTTFLPQGLFLCRADIASVFQFLVPVTDTRSPLSTTKVLDAAYYSNVRCPV